MVSWKRWFGAASVAALVAVGMAAPGEAAPPPPTRPAAGAKTVTLITGDKVEITRSGKSWDLRVQPRWGEPVAFAQNVSEDHAYVIPSDAARLITKGVLDKRLFDVAGLVEQGYDDASRASLPLITTKAAAGASVTRRLSRTGLTAMAVPKARTSNVWERIRSYRAPDRVWLDAKVRPLLDQSVPKVGAPVAWQAGFTGKGVKVAVLDTGYDNAHPDLAGRVTGSKDFTGEGVQDVNGHGTHVASTIAGSGAASGGKYKGVAPDANLLVGKVLGEGGGLESWVIAGMEWASAEGARVASMSLGTYYPADQSDPVAQAVNRLSAETSTLFVVAAGNLGEDDQSIGSPGSAAAALTVGSASKTDVLSPFSSRGPVVNDYRVKPEIVAPGESIVAARAKGTLDEYAVDDNYARLDGTSMATPHVAGAAAILAQQHPSWDGARVKAALTSSAQPIENANVFGQGAGRLDVARAFQQSVVAEASTVDLGILRWPHNGGSGTKTVTYRNDGDAVTLDLALAATGADGEPLPAGALGLQSERVTVPAGGTATATLAYDLKKAPVGSLGGWLTATSADGKVRVRTPVGGFLEPEMYDVKLDLTNRQGQPARGPFDEIFLQGAVDWAGGVDGDTLRLPPARYVVHAQVLTPRPGKSRDSVTFLAKPSFTVSADTTIRLDARQASPVQVAVDKRDARFTSLTVGGGVEGLGTFLVGIPEDYEETFAGTSGPPASDYGFWTRSRFNATDATLEVVRPERLGVDVWWAPGSPRLDGRSRVALIDGSRGKKADIEPIDVRGKAVIVTPEDGDDLTEVVSAVKAGGGKVAVAWLRPEVRVSAPDDRSVPLMYTTRLEGQRLSELAAGGKATVDVRGIRNSPYVYDVSFPSAGQPPASTTYRVRDRQLATVKARYVAPSNGPSTGYPYPSRLDAVAGIAGFCCEELELPTKRIEYFTPGQYALEWNWIAWDQNGEDGIGNRGIAEPVRLSPGRSTKMTWGGPVLGPGFGPVDGAPHAVARTGETVGVNLSLLADSESHTNWPFADQGREGDVSSTRLFRDGKLVGSSEVAGLGEFTVPKRPATLRLETEFGRDAPEWRSSTRVKAAWTMRSSGDGVLPVLAVRYQPAVDLDGFARGGGVFRLPVSVQREKGAPVSRVEKLALQVSYDDGTTWHTAKVLRHGSTWSALLTHPKSGFVSLRAQATDSDGNTVDQTIIRAYQLK